jgi:hypothetical protein
MLMGRGTNGALSFLQDSPCKLTYGKVQYHPFRNPICKR